MASPGQSRGLCGHIMAGFDKHSVCARCRDKKKGEDPCIKDKPCSHCDLLTEEQKLQLANPVYQKKKEKRELKAKAEESSNILVDPSLVSVIGLAKDVGDKSSEEVSTTPGGGKAKKMDKNSGSVTKTPASSSKKSELKEKTAKKHHSSPAKASKTTDSKLEAMDLKWSERFSRLEAMLLSKSVLWKGGKFQFSPLWAAILDFRGKWKSVNISKTVRDRAISSEFLSHRVVQECPVQRGKISIFATFGGHLGYSRKMEKCQYLENRKR